METSYRTNVKSSKRQTGQSSSMQGIRNIGMAGRVAGKGGRGKLEKRDEGQMVKRNGEGCKKEKRGEIRRGKEMKERGRGEEDGAKGAKG
jgi:hypothetical protein